MAGRKLLAAKVDRFMGSISPLRRAYPCASWNQLSLAIVISVSAPGAACIEEYSDTQECRSSSFNNAFNRQMRAKHPEPACKWQLLAANRSASIEGKRGREGKEREGGWGLYMSEWLESPQECSELTQC